MGITYSFQDREIRRSVMYGCQVVPADWAFQYDNDSKHTVVTAKGFLRFRHVRVMRWPSQPPILYPFEIFCSEVERRQRDTTHPNGEELFKDI